MLGPAKTVVAIENVEVGRNAPNVGGPPKAGDAPRLYALMFVAIVIREPGGGIPYTLPRPGYGAGGVCIIVSLSWELMNGDAFGYL